MFLDQLILVARRQKLIEIIADSADEIARIDKQVSIRGQNGLEEDLIQAERKALAEEGF
jgi:hypothetical protein